MKKHISILLSGLCVLFLLSACAPICTEGLGDPAQAERYEQYQGSLWSSMSYDFSLPDETPRNPAVRYYINWYMSHPEYVKRLATQAKPYLYYVLQQVRLRGLPAELALLPMVESAYNPFAYSSVGAEGLWQMMPGTASGFGLRLNWWFDGRRDIVDSTRSALNYLSYLGGFFHGDWLLAIAAYDSGEGMVQKAMERNIKAGQSTEFWYLYLPQETQRYVPKLLALATIIKHPYEYPIDLPEIRNVPYLAEVNVGSQIDLAHAAKLAGISLEELATLNPGFNRWATDPDGRHTLLVPVSRAAKFQKNLEAFPVSKRVTWHHYIAKSGDSLIKISKKFKVDTSLVKNVNHLKSHSIQTGQTLLIPSSLNRMPHIVMHSKKEYAFHTRYHIPQIHLTQHEVTKGDTLAKVAKHYRVKPQEICFWNGLKRKQPLPVGKKLIIWPHRKNFGSYLMHHTVRPGDTLGGIAHHYHVSIKELKKVNHMTSNTIHPKQKLIIPDKHA